MRPMPETPLIRNLVMFASISVIEAGLSLFARALTQISRNLTGSLAGALLLSILAGCGKPPEPAAQPTPRPAHSTPSPAPAVTPQLQGDADKRLNLLCWSAYVPREVVDDFAKETGIDVSVENYASNEEMLAKLRAGAGSHDLVQPNEYVLQALIQEDRLAPIDHSAIPNLKNVAPEFLSMSFDPENRFSVPYMAGTVGIVINTERVKDNIKGYGDVFQPKFKKNIVVLDDAREIVSWGLETLNLPINDISEENVAKVKPLLAKWLPLVKTFSDSPGSALSNGEAVLGVMWSGEGAKLLEQSNRFRWVIPVEGSHLFVDSLAIPKKAAHPKNAHIFMNYILRPEVSVKISNAFPYLNPNAAARDLLTPAQRNNPASFPSAEEIARMQTFKDIGKNASKIDELVTSLKTQ